MNIRSASYAGSFYTDDPAALSSQIDSFLDEAAGRSLDGIKGLVVPHAGYIYSGPVAAYSYAAIRDMFFDVVIVLAPSHRAGFSGYCVRSSGSYETPLGIVPVDEKIAGRLSSKPHAQYAEELDRLEHSLEVQLPFLQKTIGEFSLVPVIIGTVDLEVCRTIAQEIHAAIGDDARRILVVISSDLSHYHSYDKARELDRRVVSALEMYDEKLLSGLLRSGEAEACGEGPLIAGIALTKLLGAKKCSVLHYANSGDTAGDKQRVVGYLAAAITG